MYIKKTLVTIFFSLFFFFGIFNINIGFSADKKIDKSYISNLYEKIVKNQLKKNNYNYEKVYIMLYNFNNKLNKINSNNYKIDLLKEIVSDSIPEFEQKYFYNINNNTIFLYNENYFYKDGNKTVLVKDTNQHKMYKICDIIKRNNCGGVKNISFQQEIKDFNKEIIEYEPIVIQKEDILLNKIQFFYQIDNKKSIYFSFNNLSDKYNDFVFNGKDKVGNLIVKDGKLGYVKKEKLGDKKYNRDLIKILNNKIFRDIIEDDLSYININTLTEDVNDIIKTTKKITRYKRTKEDKLEAIYKYIINNIDYDYNVYNYYLNTNKILDNSKSSFNAFGTYRTKIGVCTGYSSLFKLMGAIAGIDNIEINTGYYYNKDQDIIISHAWNKIGNKYYDITFEVGNPKANDYLLYYGLPEDVLMNDRMYYSNKEVIKLFKSKEKIKKQEYIANNVKILLNKYKNNYRLFYPEYVLNRYGILEDDSLEAIFNKIKYKYTYYSEDGKLSNLIDQNGKKVILKNIEAYPINNKRILHDIFYTEINLDLILIKNTFNDSYLLLKQLN